MKDDIKYSVKEGALYDLKDIYEGKIIHDKKNPVLLEEKSVNYDLLHRDATINKLYNSIKYCRSKNSYVIGLNGEWGSGKTTIINNVKLKLVNDNDEHIHVIDSANFDPWIYSDQTVMALDLYSSILDKINVLSKKEKRRLLKGFLTISGSLINFATGFNMTEIIKLVNSENNENKYNEIKQDLLKYIGKEDKFVIFVDNIDRASSDSILMLFRLLGTLLDIPNIVYVLSYSKNRLIEIFNQSMLINKNYLEKIIQQEINIPDIDADLLNRIYDKCLVKILRLYGIGSKTINKYRFVLQFICEYVKDLRTFKRLVNSAFYEVFGSQSRVDKNSTNLAIQVIRFLDEELFVYIQDNDDFFWLPTEPKDIGEALADQTYLQAFFESHKSKIIDIKKKIKNDYSDFYDFLYGIYPIFKYSDDHHNPVTIY